MQSGGAGSRGVVGDWRSPWLGAKWNASRHSGAMQTSRFWTTCSVCIPKPPWQ
jgi:hypothetical protein